MAATVEKIMHEAMGLPPALRAFVAEKLIESLDMPDNPLSAEWQEEIQRRCAEVDNSAGQLRDADSVFKNAYASLT